MSTIPEMGAESQEPRETLENAVPLTTRISTVVLGRMGFTSVLLRLIGMELYKIRRRLMSKVLGTLALALALLVPLAVGVQLAINLSTPASSFVPACQSQIGGSRQIGCVPLSAGEQDAIKRAALAALSEPLRLPSRSRCACPRR